ncbi:MAG: type III polyketide synthase [Acidobacteriota bacterium]
MPKYKVDQETIANLAPSVFGPSFQDFRRLLPVFANTQVRTRYFSQPIEWFLRPHTFQEANRIYEETAFDLSCQVAAAVMRQCRATAEEIGMILFASTSGIATPSLDSKLIHKLRLSPNLPRIPIWGLGCAAGVASLARAAELSSTLKNRYVLLVTVELCSLTFQLSDLSKANLVASSLFGDGAAALLIGAQGEGPEILDSYSHLWEDSEDIMGWELVDTGLKVRLSRDIPSLVRTEMPKLLDASAAAWRVSRGDIRHYVLHPGGAKVLEAFAETTCIDPDVLEHSYWVLHDYGNMSSPTVLFALRHLLDTTPRTGDLGLMLAFGPGFCAEQVLFRW